jgi:hypothetical protein
LLSLTASPLYSCICRWKHPKCFAFPRNKKVEGVTVEEFVEELVEKYSGDPPILQEEGEREQLIADIEFNAARGGSAKKKRDDDDGPAPEGSVARLKEMRASMQQEEDEAPPKKKLKPLSEEDKAKVDIYVQYEKAKNDELKDILRWNRQHISGNKDMLMARIIDGQMRGRLGRCPMCIRGKLSLENEKAEHAVCHGFYNDDIGAHETCAYKCTIEEAPRKHPWYVILYPLCFIYSTMQVLTIMYNILQVHGKAVRRRTSRPDRGV